MNFEETLPQTQNIVLFGCGAMAIETAMYINDVANQLSTAKNKLLVSDIVSTEFERSDELQSVLGYNVNLHLAIENVENFQQKQSLVEIGSAEVVKSIAADVRNLGGSFITIIHPTAVVSGTANIGHGVIVAPFSFIGPFSCISDNAIVNVHSTIGHDVTVGSGVIISPHVDINGASSVGDFTFLGAGVTVDPQISIGRYTKVSSGVTVKKNVPDGMMVFNHQSAKPVKLFQADDVRSMSTSHYCEINFIEGLK